MTDYKIRVLRLQVPSKPSHLNPLAQIKVQHKPLLSHYWPPYLVYIIYILIVTGYSLQKLESLLTRDQRLSDNKHILI